jgi:hypothetical protein
VCALKDEHSIRLEGNLSERILCSLKILKGGFIMISQKECVYLAVCEVIGVDGFNGKAELSKEQLSKVHGIVTDVMSDGGAELSAEAKAKYCTRELLLTYVKGMVNNWLRKDTRLNGGSKYVTKNPGSRSGSKDPQLSELYKLKSLVAHDDESVAKVESAIKLRLEQIAAEKAPKVEINADLIPDELKDLLS